MSDRPRWSLRGRMLRWTLGSTVGLVLLLSTVSGWYLFRATEREIETLLCEELGELEAYWSAEEPESERLVEIIAELLEHHPGQPLAFRVWEPGRQPGWADFGRLDLLVLLDATPAPTDEVVVLPGNLRYRTAEMASGHRVTCAVDGSPQFQLLGSFARRAGVIVGLATLLALGTGVLLSRRVADHLAGVVAGVRAARGSEPESDIRLEGAPEEIRAVADALAETLSDIRAESERARVLMSGLAHELRSPIQNLVCQTEVALLADRSPDEYRRALEGILEELADLGETVHNILTLCSMAEWPEGKDVEAFDLGAEAELRLARLRGEAARRNVKVDLEVEGDVRAFGDREAVLRAVRNLANNAVQWSPDGGRVRVKIATEDGVVRVCVDDSGPGVPDDLRERIFEPFVRGPARPGRRAGYGLGLALARAAAEAHHGSIEVGRSPEGGARFELALPGRVRASTSETSIWARDSGAKRRDPGR